MQVVGANNNTPSTANWNTPKLTGPGSTEAWKPRYNGVAAFTLGVAGLSTENIVDVGARVDAKLAEIDPEIPVGVALNPIYQQHVVVEEASNDFLTNLAM